MPILVSAACGEISQTEWLKWAGKQQGEVAECQEWLTHTGVAINVQLVAGPAGALERSLSVDANVLTGPI